MAEPIHIREEDARAGIKLGVMRYVLSFSLGLAVVAMMMLVLFNHPV